MGRRRGFTLIELGVVIAVGAAVASLALPSAGRGRQIARARGSASNLLTIGQGAGMYAGDNAERIFSYSWQGNSPGGNWYTLPDGSTVRARSDTEAAWLQNTEILMRRTGSTDFEILESQMMLIRQSTLTLMDYLDLPFPAPLFIDPSDINQAAWSSDPSNYGPGSGVPGSNSGGGAWANTALAQRWAFGGSYQTTMAAWNSDGLNGEPTYVPFIESPHLVDRANAGNQAIVTHPGRSMSEVRFPSAKVLLFEEFDYEHAEDLYFGYDDARVSKVMFDGSVNDWFSREAASSWNAAHGKQAWVQRYVPIDTYPLPVGWPASNPPISQRYRWTLGGLQGIDYLRPLMPGR